MRRAHVNLSGKNLISFGSAKHHIAIYPTPSAVEAFQSELSGYKGGKGSFQLPLDEPLPPDLIGRMTAFRVANLDAKATAKAEAKAAKKQKP